LDQELIETDLLVIGSGVAGLFFALKSQELGRILVVSKRELWESASYYAQGGVASVVSDQDSFDAHIQDTLTAGAGLCKPGIVEMVVKGGPERIQELIKLGVRFSLRNQSQNDPSSKLDQAEFDLAREGAHSHPRILHSEDATGKEMESVLLRNCQKATAIQFLEFHQAVDLITSQKIGQSREARDPNRVLGAYVLDLNSGAVKTISAKAVILATGGAGKVYLYTSNPDLATGDGIAMAYRAGAKIANMEFFQFHPTCLFHPEAKSFLISEALRGEGAVLRTISGERFMPRYHPMAELAPRDIVTRAIDQEMKTKGVDYVLLDLTHEPAHFIKERFPNIYKTLKHYGFDLTKDQIPVVPAAHYICGGILTDEFGATNISGLYAIGENACTGLHGANRLASNSLLEALVFADRASKQSAKYLAEARPEIRIPLWQIGKASKLVEPLVIKHNWLEIRRTTWNYVGIVRSDKWLGQAQKRLDLIQEEIKQYYWDYLITGDLLELRNIATIADLITKSAFLRKESRGVHYNLDHPETKKEWEKDTIIQSAFGDVPTTVGKEPGSLE